MGRVIHRSALRSWPMLLLAPLPGCASVPASVSAVSEDAPRQIELADVPFFPQERYQCGPAALATVLSDSGVPTRPEDLVDKIYLPDRKGSLQVEILAASRSAGRLPYEIDASVEALLAELRAGNPVLILQNLGVRWIPRWHYAVVVGIDLNLRQVVLRSGTDERRVTDLDLFLRTWQRSDYWGVVTLVPGSLPARPDRQRFLRSLADLESVGQTKSALLGWQSALERWPDDGVALFGLGNSHLSSGDSASAEKAYRRLLGLQPRNVLAANNLAYAIARQGRDTEALELLNETLNSLPADSDMTVIIERSIADLEGAL